MLFVVFLVPGLAFAATSWPQFAGWRLAAAPAMSILLIGWVGWAGGLVGWRPSALALVLSATVLGAVGGLALRTTGRRTGSSAPRPGGLHPRRALTGSVTAVLGLGGGLLAGLWTWRAGGAWWAWTEAFPRFWDAPWHGYLIGLVQHTGITDVAQLVPRDPLLLDWTDYYPAGWHVVIGTAMALVGGDAAVGFLQAQFFFAVLVMPAGVVALLRELRVRSRIVLLLAPALTVLLYPTVWLVDTPAYVAALALLPVATAVTVRMVRRGWRPPDVLGAACVTAAVFLVQPAMVAVLLIVALCFVAGWLRRASLARARRPGLLRGRWRGTVQGAVLWGVATVLLALPWLWASTTHAVMTFTHSRGLDATYPEALHEIFIEYVNSAATPTLALALLLAAVLLLVIRRHRWLILATVMFAVLYLVARAERSDLRQILTGFWYTDWYRLGAVTWVLAAVVCCCAVDALLRLRPAGLPRPAPVAAGAAVLVLLGLGLPTWLQAAQDRVESRRTTVARAGTMRDGFAVLASLVPRDARVLNDWPDGSSWMYALRGVHPLMIWTTSEADADRLYLVTHFAEIGWNPRIRELLARYDIRYIFQGPPGGIAIDSRLQLPPGAAGLDRVYQDDWVRVYRIPDTGLETS